ncbi:MAG: 3-hydroxyacyl-CoA dehydrogenase family protein, partial [Oscillospiraceae bacterium]|nr:3-hydroxyacyl-CoA dehydrogenase family protein [Oscillospiraceae bacterium]
AISPEDAILTSNTSGLSLTEIAKAVKKPERFCGMHWVNPPHIVPLVEVIKGEKTSDATADAVYENAVSVGKKPIIVKKDVPGFVLNRIQFAILRESMNIVENGIASIEDVDNSLKYGLGMRYAAIGPFETADFGGLDTFYNIASYLFADLSDRKTVNDMLSDLFNSESYGVKSGKGFYDYSNGKDKEAIRRRDKMFIKLAECLYSE